MGKYHRHCQFYCFNKPTGTKCMFLCVFYFRVRSFEYFLKGGLMPCLKKMKRPRQSICLGANVGKWIRPPPSFGPRKVTARPPETKGQTGKLSTFISVLACYPSRTSSWCSRRGQANRTLFKRSASKLLKVIWNTLTQTRRFSWY
jgi:hypothetical protein